MRSWIQLPYKPDFFLRHYFQYAMIDIHLYIYPLFKMFIYSP